jgi:hypothetical protein
MPLLASIPLALGLAWVVFWVFDTAELRKVGSAATMRDALQPQGGENRGV